MTPSPESENQAAAWRSGTASASICRALVSPKILKSQPSKNVPDIMPTASNTDWTMRSLERVEGPDLEALCTVLCDCVEGGASVSFMLPFPRERARDFWLKVDAGLQAGTRAVLVAEDADGICGTVQVVWDLPENQAHRADVAKMLVHRRARRRGIALALLQAAEDAARTHGKTLLVLDTVTGGAAELLYEKAGWSRVGVIPDYAMMPDGAPCATTVFSKQVGPHPWERAK